MAKASTARERESIRRHQLAYLCELPHHAGLHLPGEVSGRLRDPVPEQTCGVALGIIFAKALGVADRRHGASQGPHGQQESSTVPSHLRPLGSHSSLTVRWTLVVSQGAPPGRSWMRWLKQFDP